MSKSYFENEKLENLLEKADVVVYDLNGLIVDDEPLHLIASNVAIEAYYKKNKPQEAPPQMSEEEWGEKCVGRHPQDWLPVILKRPLEKDELDFFIKAKDESYFNQIGDKAAEIVRPGVMDLIHYVASTGRPLALATSSTPEVVERVLGPEGLDVRQLFEYCVCGNMVEKKKPNPEIYNNIKSYFELTRGKELHLLVIEDAGSGVEAAKGAGMDCIAVPNKYTITQDLSKADAIIDSQLSNAAIIMPSGPGFSATQKKGPSPENG